MTVLNIYDKLATVIKGLGISLTVTRRALSLGSQDSTTGWYAKSFATSDIEMVIVSKGAQDLLTGTGLYVKLDAIGLTRTAVEYGDEIDDKDGRYYLVCSVAPHQAGNELLFYETQLAHMPLHS